MAAAAAAPEYAREGALIWTLAHCRQSLGDAVAGSAVSQLGPGQEYDSADLLRKSPRTANAPLLEAAMLKVWVY